MFVFINKIIYCIMLLIFTVHSYAVMSGPPMRHILMLWCLQVSEFTAFFWVYRSKGHHSYLEWWLFRIKPKLSVLALKLRVHIFRF